MIFMTIEIWYLYSINYNGKENIIIRENISVMTIKIKIN